MASDTEAARIQDVVKFEPDKDAGRQELLVGASQTLTIGELVRKGASGRMIAYAAPVNEKQQFKITGTVAAGTFTLEFIDKDGIRATTDPFAEDGNNAAIQTACDSVLGAGAVDLTGTTIADIIIEWIGEDYAGRPQELVTLNGEGATGVEDITVERTQTGGWGGAAASEVQTATQSAVATGSGTWTITFDHWDGTSETTAAIEWDASLVQIQAAVDLLTGDTSQITVAGEMDQDVAIVFTYDGSMYEDRDIENLFSIDISGLTGPATSTVVQTTKGGPGGSQTVGGITLRDVTTAGGVLTTEGLFLTRGPAVVDVDKLDFGSSIRLDVIDELQALGIMVRPEA